MGEVYNCIWYYNESSSSGKISESLTIVRGASKVAYIQPTTRYYNAIHSSIYTATQRIVMQSNLKASKLRDEYLISYSICRVVCVCPALSSLFNAKQYVYPYLYIKHGRKCLFLSVPPTLHVLVSIQSGMGSVADYSLLIIPMDRENL